MGHNLAIFSQLVHDGDGLVRYRVLVESESFRAETELWGGPTDPMDLATALRAFHPAPSAKLESSLGSPGTGTVVLRFEAVDALGHCRV